MVMDLPVSGRQLIDGLRESAMLTSSDGAILAVNSAFTSVTGYTSEEAIGKNARLLKSGRQDGEFYKEMWFSISEYGYWHGEIWNRRKNGEVYPELLTISAIRDDKGHITHYLAVFTDITLLKISHERLTHLAHYDVLTGLPNRVLLLDRLGQALALAHRSGNFVGILLLDIDSFKGVNDSFGHMVGDLLLEALARRLEKQIRHSDTLARLGGDEF